VCAYFLYQVGEGGGTSLLAGLKVWSFSGPWTWRKMRAFVEEQMRSAADGGTAVKLDFG